MQPEPDIDDLARTFRALSAESRLRILRLLAGRALCVGALSHRLGMTPGAVSQHLRVLKEAGLVKAVRRGTFIHYRVAGGASGRCRAKISHLFRPTKGARPCAAARRSAKDRKS